MVDIVFSMFKVILAFLKYPAIIVAGILGVFGACCLYQYSFYYRRGYRLKKSSVKHTKTKKSKFRRLFIELPRQFVFDFITREPDDFKYQGVIIFTGRQGRGKTVGMVRQILDYQAEFPLCKVLTNFNFKYQDKQLDHWKRLVDFKNGKKGVVACIDETQNWFSCNQSKQFPPEMLSVVTQNRKNKRIILGTAQNFYLLAKALRSQCTEVRECYTVLGCLTIVRRREPILDSSGEVKEWKNRGSYFFVHDKKLRTAYDTYKVIENLSKSGFVDTEKAV